MDCSLTRAELVRFHFGALDDPERGELEAHLRACPECLQAFFALKRTVEGDARPSPAAHGRLRAAVAAKLARDGRDEQAGWLWWQRPVALTLALGAMLLAFLAVESLPAMAMASPQLATAAREAQ